jgi:hypothetical protein
MKKYLDGLWENIVAHNDYSAATTQHYNIQVPSGTHINFAVLLHMFVKSMGTSNGHYKNPFLVEDEKYFCAQNNLLV